MSFTPRRNASQRPVSRTPLLSASIALRAALMRSTASARSNSGFALSPVKSSIERPATPVFTARATLTPTLSGSWAKPSSKSALTGISTAAQIAARCVQTSSTVTRLSALPSVQAKPALVEASALKPRCCKARALPTSKGLGMMKHPLSCNFLNAARLSAGVSMVAHLNICWRREHNGATSVPPDASRHDLAQERALLGEDELVLLGKTEIGHAFAVGTQPRPVAFIGGETLERDQREGDVVSALMRHPVADQVAAAFRDDGEPVFRILLELGALERIELVADENGDGHCGAPMVISPSLRAQRSNPCLCKRRDGLLRRF